MCIRDRICSAQPGRRRFFLHRSSTGRCLDLPMAAVYRAPMNGWKIRLLALIVCWLAFPCNCPAPLIYRPGEGWTYEPVGGGGGKWQRARAEDQLQVAQAAFDKQDYNLALKAARRVVNV